VADLPRDTYSDIGVFQYRVFDDCKGWLRLGFGGGGIRAGSL